jgi:hypothetical protein
MAPRKPLTRHRVEHAVQRQRAADDEPEGTLVQHAPDLDPNAPSEADGDRRRALHQSAVEGMAGGEPYVLTHEQAEAMLDSLGIDPATLFDRHEDDDGRGTLVGHVHQAEGDTVAKLVRHYMKWVRRPGEVTTIPLNETDLAALKAHQPKDARLQRLADLKG